MSETPNSEVIIDLAKNKWVKGDKEDAITDLELWIETNPEDKNALLTVSQYYLAENRPVDARRVFKALEQLVPDNSMILNNLAWLMMETDVDQGIVYAEKALDVTPDNPFVLDTLAMLLLKKGDAVKSLENSEKAAKLAPKVLDIQINYAKVLNANNRSNEAKDLLNDIYYETKSSEVKKKIRKALDSL